jgi:hypothetical protein
LIGLPLTQWTEAVGIGVGRPGKASAAVGIFIGFCLNENMVFAL